MTKSEVNKLLALMKANYSYAFKNMSRQEKILLLNTWAFTLQDLDAGVVMIAVMQLISTSKWLPTVAEIREKCKDLYYEASFRECDVFFDDLPESEKAAYRAIADKTSRLRGDGPAKLTLGAMLHNPQIAALAAGQQRMELLDSADGEAWKEDAPNGEWEERMMNE